MKTKTARIMALFIVGVGSCATAQTKAVFTVGGTYWNANLSYSGDVYEGVTVEPGNMIGPYVNVRLGNWLFGTSMYFGTFEFKQEFEDYGYEFGIDLKRSDLNFSLGYSIHKNLNLFAAVKNISVTGSQSEPFVYVDPYTYMQFEGELETEMENKGTLIGGGVSGVFPLQNSPFFLFGSVAYLSGTLNRFLDQTVDGQPYYDYKDDVKRKLVSWNAGIGLLAQSGISVLLGYRGDATTGAKKEEGKENISGIMATVAFTLR